MISKTFAMPRSVGVAEGAERMIETRIQIRKESGWYGFSYQWDDEQTDATLVLGGGEGPGVAGHGAQVHSNRYEIPNANQCLSCHSENGRFVPAGADGRQSEPGGRDAEGWTTSWRIGRSSGS